LPTEASADGDGHPPIMTVGVAVSYDYNALIEHDGFTVFQKT
jgi:hypothetical protein